MAVVKDFYIGQARMMIDDTYCKDKTPQDIREIYDKIAEDIYPVLRRQYMQEMREKEPANMQEGRRDR